MILLSKIEHRGATRIKVQFDLNAQLHSKVRSLEGRLWSRTKRCWHLPYSKKSFENLKTVFGSTNLVFPKKIKSKAIESNIALPKKEISKEIKLTNPTVQFTTYVFENEIRRAVVGKKIIVQKKNSKYLNVFVPKDKKGWQEVLKNINGRIWNIENVCWEIPNVKQSYRQLKEHIEMKNIQFDFKIEKDIPEEYFPKISFKPNYKTKSIKKKQVLNSLQKSALIATEEQLILLRYSFLTIKSYRTCLIDLFIFFEKTAPEQIDSSLVQKFLLHKIRFKKISESTQNQIISAYKFYTEKVLKRPKIKIDIPRPKKSKRLPNVLSEKEVIDLLKATQNIKHKFCLLLIYSSGLRLGEVVSLRVRDINITRRSIFIRKGKGKKDRYVVLSEIALRYLKVYKRQYGPKYWLFEGVNGGQYSKRSVQKVFTRSKIDSKINPFATVHTLRHSYATHCLENGFNLKMIKEALGHSSIKTTEKYTHLVSKSLQRIKSPLDYLG